ncbi:tail fiber-like protein [Synechococcus phage S-CAM3]|uniref:Tail fiber-like protein n=1 Tax=Synechococcus phage S-CAM3 TaxID=1883366 RepID=A0A1D8KJL7_9CAUD|nr:tail fiber-like protein [Synechococcus phage S-CAM3]
MADFRLGRLKFNWTGDWVAATDYVIDDIVKFGANTYVAKANHTASSNESMWYSQDAQYWDLHTESLDNKGDWAQGTFYKLNDVVKYGNSVYRVIQSHTAAAEFADDEANFELFVAGLVFEDTYDAATTYQPGDVVSFGGYTYVATSIHSGSSPNLLTNWEIVTTGFKVKGTWDGATEYVPGDVVLLGGNSYVAKTTNTGQNPGSSAADWDFIVGGFTWQGIWDVATTYYAGDAVVRNSNSYIAVAESTGEEPETDATGTYWNTLAEGAQANVLTQTGDVLYRAGAGAARLPIGNNGQVFAVSPTGVPQWENNNVTDPVYYVTEEGSDGNTGENISRSFASLSYAVTQVTGPATIYVKAGTYFENLPIIVPEYVSIVGDNMRTSTVKPDAGQNSRVLELTLAGSVADEYKVDGLVISNGAGSKTAYVLHTKIVSGNDVIQILPITGGDWTTADTYESGASDTPISTVDNVLNEHATMFYMSNKSMLKDLVMDGMEGFVPSLSDPKDLNTATIKGVFLRLWPNSPTTKSPYISQCSAFSQAGVGAIVDGDVHKKWEGTATPSNKSMLFDSFTQIHESNGVGFWLTNNGNSEIVSSFTYYAHISYCASNGGNIRSLAGNSSWGNYGIISSGFNADEVTKDGRIDGEELNYQPETLSDIFNVGERIEGFTSGAIAEVLSQQVGVAKLLIRPLKGSFISNETITGDASSSTAVLDTAATYQDGQKGFTLIVRDLDSAPKPGGSIEFITGPNGEGPDIFTYVISNSSYKVPDGKGDLVVTRGSLGTASVTHDGLSDIVRYTVSGQTTLTAAPNGTTTQLAVTSINGMSNGGFLIIDNEMVQITGFPNPNTVDVVRGVQTTTAAPHNASAVATIVTAYNPTQTENIGDLTNSQTSIRVFAEDNIQGGDYIRIDNEFMLVNASVEDPNGQVTLILAEEKPNPSYDGQNFKIRYLYSQVRLTGHDFLNIGTGTKTQTNFPGLPIQSPAPGNEVTENFPGRVYYVSTDQDGNFSVGKYFRVNQSTGSTTLNASSFDLSGLTSLQLGSIGGQIGESINEFSSDGTLSSDSNQKVPTESAVKTYVDTELTNLKGYIFWAGGI